MDNDSIKALLKRALIAEAQVATMRSVISVMVMQTKRTDLLVARPFTSDEADAAAEHVVAFARKRAEEELA